MDVPLAICRVHRAWLCVVSSIGITLLHGGATRHRRPFIIRLRLWLRLDLIHRESCVRCVYRLYVIEPPDILIIEALNEMPRSPYVLEVGDVLSVEVDGGAARRSNPRCLCDRARWRDQFGFSFTARWRLVAWTSSNLNRRSSSTLLNSYGCRRY